MTFGELFLPGETDQEVLITCHICHPSLANDNLSGFHTSFGDHDHGVVRLGNVDMGPKTVSSWAAGNGPFVVDIYIQTSG